MRRGRCPRPLPSHFAPLASLSLRQRWAGPEAVAGGACDSGGHLKACGSVRRIDFARATPEAASSGHSPGIRPSPQRSGQHPGTPDMESWVQARLTPNYLHDWSTHICRPLCRARGGKHKDSAGGGGSGGVVGARENEQGGGSGQGALMPEPTQGWRWLERAGARDLSFATFSIAMRMSKRSGAPQGGGGGGCGQTINSVGVGTTTLTRLGVFSVAACLRAVDGGCSGSKGAFFFSLRTFLSGPMGRGGGRGSTKTVILKHRWGGSRGEVSGRLTRNGRALQHGGGATENLCLCIPSGDTKLSSSCARSRGPSQSLKVDSSSLVTDSFMSETKGRA